MESRLIDKHTLATDGRVGSVDGPDKQMWDEARAWSCNYCELLAKVREGLRYASTYTLEKVQAVLDSTRAPAVAGRFVVHEHSSPLSGVTYEVYDNLHGETRAVMNDVGHIAQGPNAQGEWIVDYVGRHAADVLAAVLNAEEDALRAQAQD